MGDWSRKKILETLVVYRQPAEEIRIQENQQSDKMIHKSFL